MGTELQERVAAALREAEHGEDTARLATLRLVSAAIRDREMVLDASRENPLQDGDVQAILQKMLRQRESSIQDYEESGRLELAEREREEARVISEFLPHQLGDEELLRAIDEAIKATKATSVRHVGKVMGHLQEKHPGQMDVAAITEIVQQRLCR